MRAPHLRIVAVAGLAAVVLAAAAGSVAGAPLDAQRERVRSLEAELSRIDARVGDAADAAAHARTRLDGLRDQITANTAAARRAARAGTRANRRLEERLVAIYTSPAPDPLAVLLTSGSLSEAVAAQDVIERAGRRDARLVAEVLETRARLRTERRRLVAARARATTAEREARENLATMEGLLEERRAVLSGAQRELRAGEARRARAAALARAQRAAEEEARRRARAARPDPPTTSPAPATPAPAPDPVPEPTRPSGDGPVAGGPSYATLARIAQCESGGNPRAVSSSGLYRGKYQFDLSTWASVGGSGDPAAASEAEQDRRAAMLYIQRGPAPWPICGYR